MNVYEEAIKLHKKLGGKIDISLKANIDTKEQLSLLYSPGVAQPCLEIAENNELAYDYTIKNNMIAVVSDGSAVLGLGNIGGSASIPVMEGKAALFKAFGDVNAFPICLDTQDDEEIINIVKNIAPVFGGINLEDISAPRCFYIEEKLSNMLDIPVFHDDQHGTAIVCLAGLINALKVVKKDNNIKIVVNGLGSAGVAITKLLVEYGFSNFSLCDINGEIFSGKLDETKMNDLVKNLNELKQNNGNSLSSALENADVFIGVSAANILTKEMVAKMNNNPIIFAMANPNPEISYDLARECEVAIMATGRSDYPNQINNVLVFPGVFKGALSAKATKINKEMKLAAAMALVDIISDEELNSEYIIPSPFDKRVVDKISEAIKNTAIATGVVRK
ncbi:malate dehydrogenase (oxaloacetate-decarboxylating) [Bacilli bacterium PM5-9]|nr:malate dehydrogenase (oxaloacetate-decarboxylating) [Bacilli bacterium PM5-9]